MPMVTKPFVGQSAPWLSFVPAVLLSAWYGGFIPGIITSLMLVVANLTLGGVLFTSNSDSGFAGVWRFHVHGGRAGDLPGDTRAAQGSGGGAGGSGTGWN